MRAIEFTASNPGDWALHCHKSHHTMNAMGHEVPTTIGVNQAGVAKKITSLLPDYMSMGEAGGSMGEMEMPLPDNTLPMMTGTGPYGGIEMGRMFTTVTIRPDLARGNFKDPGWYRAPGGTVAYLLDGEMPLTVRNGGTAPPGDAALQVRKPTGPMQH